MAINHGNISDSMLYYCVPTVPQFLAIKKKKKVANVWNFRGCTSTIMGLWLYYVLIAVLVIVT